MIVQVRPICFTQIGFSHRAAARIFSSCALHTAAICRHRAAPSVAGQPSGSTSVDSSELRKFALLSESWWRDDDGPFAALHAMNRVRVPLIRRAVLELTAPQLGATDAASPLRGVRILDVGCGGGILSEALARQGASVFGIDAAQENILAAEHHRQLDPTVLSNLQYEAVTAEVVAGRGAVFDAVVASEVLEHVSDVPLFLGARFRKSFSKTSLACRDGCLGR
jgi:ubiquinone biosynthesis O-methyltransferase